MKATVAAIATFGVLATAGAVPAAGQAQWDERDVEGGKEFRLHNDEGGAIALRCLVRGVGGGFEFAEPIEPTQRATVRGIPGERRNVAVQLSGDRLLRIAGGQGRDFVLRLLRNSASLTVRAAGRQMSFRVFGSDAIVSQCLQQQESAPQDQP